MSDSVKHDASREQVRQAEEAERKDRIAQSDSLAEKAHQQAKAFTGKNDGCGKADCKCTDCHCKPGECNCD